jgi:Gluconate 2-dehydrogenase subunit 3
MDRKQFLTILGRSALFAAAAPALENLAEGAPTAPALDTTQRALLTAFADDIIPATDGMPSASDMGAAAYLERVAATDPAIAVSLRDSVTSIDRRARAAHAETFVGLPAPARIALMEAMEKDEPDLFRAARDFVYESYYTNPLVWKRLGYDFIGAESVGPPLEPFEEALLERVRALPRLYRAIP